MKDSEPTVQDPASAESEGEANRRFAQELTHAFGGAVVFSFPMLMTMEMWWLGFYMDPLRLALFIALDIPLLIGLSRYVGFQPGSQLLSDILDAFASYAVGFVTAALLLLLFAIIGPGMSANEIIGKIAVQAVPASIGAALARSQYGEREQEDEKRRSARYGGGLFLMGVGALYLSASVAATEEMVLISYKMAPEHVLLLLVFSLAVMHGFVRAVVTQGKITIPPDGFSFWPLFLRFTVAGYGIALLISVFMLWIFGRAGGLEMAQVVQATIVLGFPAALGAGAARLLL